MGALGGFDWQNPDRSSSLLFPSAMAVLRKVGQDNTAACLFTYLIVRREKSKARCSKGAREFQPGQTVRSQWRPVANAAWFTTLDFPVGNRLPRNIRITTIL